MGMRVSVRVDLLSLRVDRSTNVSIPRRVRSPLSCLLSIFCVLVIAAHRRLSQFNSKTRRFVGGLKTEYSSNFKSSCYGGDSDDDNASHGKDESPEARGEHQRYESRPGNDHYQHLYPRPAYESNLFPLSKLI